LTLSGTINPQDHTITKSGVGPVVIEQSINTTGDLLLDQGSVQLLGENASFGNIAPSNSLLMSFVPSGGGDVIVGDATHNATLTANSIDVNSLTIGAGSTVTINAVSGGPTTTGGAGNVSQVPEPGTWVLLAAGAACLLSLLRPRRRAAVSCVGSQEVSGCSPICVEAAKKRAAEKKTSVICGPMLSISVMSPLPSLTSSQAGEPRARLA